MQGCDSFKGFRIIFLKKCYFTGKFISFTPDWIDMKHNYTSLHDMHSFLRDVDLYFIGIKGIVCSLSVNTGPLANGQWTLLADQWLFKLLTRIG